MASVGFIGTGEIASAMVNGLTDMGHKIYVSKRGVKFSNKLSLLNDVQISNNQDIINKSDIIILCLLKDIASEVLSKLYFPDDKKIISVMVDVSFSELNILCNPLNKIEITIPLPFIDTGNCPLPCFPTSSIVSDLFGKKNNVFIVNSETGLNAHFAVSAMASVILHQAQIASKWLSHFINDKNNSETYVLKMLGEYLISVSENNKIDLHDALDALNTSGGLNQTLRKHMEKSGLSNDLIIGLDNLRERLKLPLK